jgi:hypothetical protein
MKKYRPKSGSTHFCPNQTTAITMGKGPKMWATSVQKNPPKVNNHPMGGKIAKSGTDIMIFKIFSPKNSAKKLAFLTQNKAILFKIVIITLFFEKNANFFAENCQKSQKIVIITSTPGLSETQARNTNSCFSICPTNVKPIQR